MLSLAAALATFVRACVRLHNLFRPYWNVDLSAVCHAAVYSADCWTVQTHAVPCRAFVWTVGNACCPLPRPLPRSFPRMCGCITFSALTGMLICLLFVMLRCTVQIFGRLKTHAVPCSGPCHVSLSACVRLHNPFAPYGIWFVCHAAIYSASFWTVENACCPLPRPLPRSFPRVCGCITFISPLTECCFVCCLSCCGVQCRFLDG
jgi:hypothetical protein